MKTKVVDVTQTAESCEKARDSDRELEAGEGVRTYGYGYWTKIYHRSERCR